MPLGRAAVALTTLVLAATLAGCAERAGDRLLNIPDRADDERDGVERTLNGVAALLERLPLPAERKRRLESLRPTRVIRESRRLDLDLTSDAIVLTQADIEVSAATNTIIVAAGSIRIAHCESSIVISGRDVAISHDGSRGGGSLVVSKGSTRISHARNTLIYAVEGVQVSFANDVRAFNTPDRVTSWGHIDNTLIEPLFKK